MTRYGAGVALLLIVSLHLLTRKLDEETVFVELTMQESCPYCQLTQP